MKTIFDQTTYVEEIKKSRFIATCGHAQSDREALRFIEERSRPDATHNCSAYRIGDIYRFNDDGEPGGTAGRPILAAIDGQGLDCVVVLVTRYFGGIKLGAGGLVRAYGGTAAKCLNAVDKVEVKPTVSVRVAVPFDDIGSIYPLIAQLDAEKTGEKYTETGVVIDLEIAEDCLEDFARMLKNDTRGRAELQRS